MTNKERSVSSTSNQSNIMKYIRLAFFGILIGFLYQDAIRWLVEEDWSREDYSYAYLILPIVLYLLWDKRQRLKNTPAYSSWHGLWPIAMGVSLYWLGELAGEMFSLYVSMWLVAVGAIWLVLGWKKLAEMAFPLIFAIAMFPLPNFLYNKVSVQLKLISSQIGVAMIQAFGMSAYREGNIIDLGFTQLQVVDACSGLRFLIPLIVLGVLLAYFYKAAWWKRILLVCSAIPLSIVTNSLRIALTGVLYDLIGQEAAEGFFHGFSGWFIFMFSLVVLLMEMWIFKYLPPRAIKNKMNEAGSESEISDDAQAEDYEGQNREWPETKAPWLKFSIGAAMVLLSIYFTNTVDFREKIPIIQSFDNFPMQIGDWTGRRSTIEERFLITLDLSDYIMADYRNPQGQSVNFYVAYYQSQSKGKAIHSPETCLPGSGWLFREAGAVSLDIPNHDRKKMAVNRAVMQKGPYKQLSYFWFDQRGRTLTNAFELKWFTFWDALTQQRTDGALVRIITPIYEGEEMAKAEERLKQFTQELMPVLEKYIPGQKL